VRAKVVYAAIVVFVTLLAGFVGNILYTNHVDARRAASDRANAAARERQGEQTRQLVCRLVLAQVQADEETPPVTTVGQNRAEAWRDLRVQFGC
jgi:uncharacterized membrane protein YcjF (UPF0283 family)